MYHVPASDDGFLYAAKPYRPIWRTAGPTVSVRDEAASGRGTELQAIVPDPFTERATFSYRLHRSGHVRITLHDLLGREIAELQEGVKEEGEHRTEIERMSLTPGLYFVRLVTDDQVFSRRVMLR